MSDPRISVRLDAALQRRLVAEAQATGKNESELVRAALAAYFQHGTEPEDCLALARRHALVGCAKRLPADLSTNPDYRDGLGR